MVSENKLAIARGLGYKSQIILNWDGGQLVGDWIPKKR